MSTPGILKLLEVLTGQLDEIEDIFEYIRTNMSITDAEGVWLDRIHGTIVGLERPYREQAYGTIFAFKGEETDLDDPLKGFESAGVGGYFLSSQGLKYLADPTERMSDDDYRERIRGKAIANFSSGTVNDIWRFSTTGFGQTNPTIESTAGAVNITIAEDDIMTQGDRNILAEKGPIADGVGVNVDNWTSEYLPFGDDVTTVADWEIDTDTINGSESKILRSVNPDNAFLDMTTHFATTASAVAYGTWEFWIYKPNAAAVTVYFISDSKSSQTGYAINIGTTETIGVWRYTSGSVTSTLMSVAAGTFPADDWAKFTITRDALNSFSVYMDDVLLTAASGSNPATDSTHTTGKYMQLSTSTDVAIGLAVVDDDTKLTTWTSL